MRHTNYNFT
jgi:nucleolar GTP-binding protein